MPQWHRQTCRVCGRRDDENGGISGSGLCLEHGIERRDANIRQLIDHRGPYFDHWRQRSLAALGVTLPESQKAS